MSGLHAEFEAAATDARALFEGVGADAFRWRPAEKGWSMAECLDHLNVVGRKYLKAIDRAIEDGRAKGLLGAGPFRYGLIESFVVRTMDAPPMFRMKAPRSFVPAASADASEALLEFVALQRALQERLARAEGLDLVKVKVPSPVSRRLKFSLGKSFAAMAAHQRRHLWQARQVRALPSFPASP